MQGGGRGQTRRELWPWLALLPFGLGSWAPLIAARRTGNPAYAAIGLGWSAVAVGGIVVSGTQNGHVTLGGYLSLASWVGGAISALAVRSHSERWYGDDDAIEPAGGSTAHLTPTEPGGRHPAQATYGGQRRDRWPWVSLAPLGLGAWAPLIAGVRCRRLGWSLGGIAATGSAAGGWAVAAATGTRAGGAIGVLLVCAGWIGGIVASFAIRPHYEWQRHAIPINPVRWPQPTARSRRFTVRYALCAFVATFVGVLALGLVLVDGLDVHVKVGPSVLIVDAALLLALVPLWRRRRLSAADIGLRATLGMRSSGLVALALFVYVLIAGVWALIVQPPSTTRAAKDLVTTAHLSTLNIVLAVIALSASAPIVEEIFFRGLLYRSLRNRLSPWPAALIAGCLFGLVHITGYPLITLPVKAAFGVLACLLYERTGSLLPGIALHSFIDASAADLAFTGNDLIVLGCAAAAMIVIFLRFLTTGPARRNPAYPRGGAGKPAASTLTPP